MTEVGVLVNGFPRTDSLGSIARAVEGLGFDSIWSGDHVLSTVDGLVACAAFAAATERIRIGTAVYLPHLRPAPAVARMLATVEAAGARGRFTFGVGVGGDVPAEFDVLGVDIRRRGALLDDSLDALHRFFEEDDSFLDHGAFPPVWTGGRSVAALRRGLRMGCGFAPYLVTLEQFRCLQADIPADAEQRGFESAANLLVAVDTAFESGADAALRGRPFELSPELITKHVISGNPTECASRLNEYVMAGARHLIVNLAVAPDAKHEQLAVIAEEILPVLHAGSRAALTTQS
jgi:alkanesulfonate monooxygenase SsuD/methylene tetrahydromethanopterin reductase-like flavin-dependent oxidoreductase (luciferase family)